MLVAKAIRNSSGDRPRSSSTRFAAGHLGPVLGGLAGMVTSDCRLLNPGVSQKEIDASARSTTLNLVAASP
jgi:hypothetical protein